MTGELNRRNFLLASGACLASADILAAAAPTLSVPPRRYFRAVKLNMVQGELSLLEKFQLLKRLRFDGVELDSPNDYSDEEVLAARKTAGLRIHGVVDSVHWRKTLSDPNAEVRKAGIAGLETALRDAKTYTNGSFPLRFTSSGRIANFLVAVQQLDLGIDYIKKRPGFYNAVTLEDIKRVAKRLIKPEKMLTIIVGEPVGISSSP